MREWLKKTWETIGIGLITVAMVGVVSWWGSYQGTTVTISRLCSDVSELTKVARENTINMAAIKVELSLATIGRDQVKEEVVGIKNDLRKIQSTMDRHLLESEKKWSTK